MFALGLSPVLYRHRRAQLDKSQLPDSRRTWDFDFLILQVLENSQRRLTRPTPHLLLLLETILLNHSSTLFLKLLFDITAR